MAHDSTATTQEDTSKVIRLSATDADNRILSYQITSLPTHGKLYRGDPSDPNNEIKGTDLPLTLEREEVTYKPDPNYNNTAETPDTFEFLVNDGTASGNSESEEATVSVTVNPVNDAPVATDDAATTPEDTAVTVDVLANDTDPDSTNLTTTMVSGPANGELTHNPHDGSFTYNPNADYTGADSFTYRTSDGQLGSNIATVRITVEDATAPKVTSVVPAEGATGIEPGANISAFFSEAMRAGSIDANTVKLFKVGRDGGVALEASVSYDRVAKKATLEPSSGELELGARYRVVVTPGAKDKAGNRLDQDGDPSNGKQRKVWYFIVKN